MKHYLRVFLKLWEASFSAQMAWRSDTFIYIIVAVGWSLTSIGILKVIYAHTSNLNGWNETQAILLLFCFMLGTEIGEMFGRDIEVLETRIRRGTFDGLLTKPLDAQFLAVFGQPDPLNIVYIISFIAPYVFLLRIQGMEIAWSSLPWAFVLLASANLLWMSLKTMLMTLNFWWQSLDNLSNLLYTIMEVGKYPITVYPKTLRILFYTGLPIAFVAFVPAQVFMGEISWYAIGGAILAAAVALACSRCVWRKAIRNYSSASN